MSFARHHFDAAVSKMTPGPRSAVEKAVAAGVPWTVILAWLIQYGPVIFSVIDTLLKNFRPIPPAPVEPLEEELDPEPTGRRRRS